MKIERSQISGTTRIPRLLVIFSLLTLSTLIAACGDDNNGNGEVLRIGALLDLSGSWQTLGKASQATLEIAVQDYNKSHDQQVQVVVKDTGLNPDKALTELRALADEGIRIVIGPQSSSEVAKVKEYADSNGIIIISQGSTASSLSLENDNIFRFTPDDRREGEAVTALMLDEGKITVLPVCRNDAGNIGLCDSVTRELQQRGGTVLPRVTYEGSAQPTETLTRIKNALGSNQGPSVAIYLAAFEEAVGILSGAAADAGLRSLRWYGSDGMALNSELIATSSSQAAQLAQTVSYPNPLFGLDPQKERQWQPLFDQVKAKVGYDPDAFALSTYDALNIAATAYRNAGGVGDVAKYRQQFAQVAKSQDSLTGSTELNEAGDRKSGVFDFWAVRSAVSAYQWVKIATYRPTGDGRGTIVRLAQ